MAASGLPSVTPMSERSFTVRRKRAYSLAPSFRRKSRILSRTSDSLEPVKVREKPVNGMVTVAEVPAAFCWKRMALRTPA